MLLEDGARGRAAEKLHEPGGRHRLTRRLAATVSYAFENFKVYDFAMDPSVVDSIIQPSSLVLGYVYRPYTTHTAVVGLLYLW